MTVAALAVIEDGLADSDVAPRECAAFIVAVCAKMLATREGAPIEAVLCASVVEYAKLADRAGGVG